MIDTRQFLAEGGSLGILNLNTSLDTTMKETAKVTSAMQHCNSFQDGRPGSFPDSVLKAVVREVSPFYPGVPLRRLFKRYKARHEKIKLDNETTERCGALDKNTGTASFHLSDTAVKAEVGTMSNKSDQPRRRGRPKRRLSSEGTEKQQKIARTGTRAGQNDSTRSVGSERVFPTGQVGQKRGREGEEPVLQVRRKSTRLQQKKETQDDSVPCRMNKRRKTDDSLATAVPGWCL